MNRRLFLAASTATAAATALKAAAATTEPLLGETGVPLRATGDLHLPLGPLPGSRYPDPHIEALDKRFKGSPGTGAVERVATGFRWAEGPAYFRAGRYLIFSDIPNNRQMRLVEDDNHLSVFRTPSFNSNGNTVDREGRLLSCEHSGRRVIRTELDGTITVIADNYNGKPLNSPNDRGRRLQRLDLVYRPELRDRRQLRGTESRTGAGDPQRLSGRPADRQRHSSSSTTSHNPTASASRPTRKSSTSSTAASPTADLPISASSMWISTRARSATARYSPRASRQGLPTACACDIEGNVWCSMGWADPKEDGVRCYSPGGDSARQDPPAGDLRQSCVRRIVAKPAVYVREHLDLCVLREHARCGQAVIWLQGLVRSGVRRPNWRRFRG